jgi:NAD(P)-dependent dehydrogenase (short-subunit alcohol dehydrogenase family)
MPSPKSHLMSKVVLLIGNDAEVLHALAAKLAANGGDIALASSQLSAEAAKAIQESVQAYGGRFLLLDRGLVKNGLSNVQKTEAIINNIKRELGRMDIVVDMSAHKGKGAENETTTNSDQSQWWLSTAILQEIGS